MQNIKNNRKKNAILTKNIKTCRRAVVLSSGKPYVCIGRPPFGKFRGEDSVVGCFFSHEYNVFMDSFTIGRYARIIMDDWFKRSFELFLAELIPERKIQKLTFEPQEHVSPFPDNKSVRIDAECTDEDGARFVVEMQVAPQNSFYDRAVFNSTFAVQQQLVKGGDDYAFPTVYFIGIMDFSFHKGSEQVLYRYTIRENDSNELMTPHLQYIFLELPNCQNALSPEASVLENICYVLHNMENFTDRPALLKEEIFKLLFDSAEIAKFTPEEKAKYELNMRTERDLHNQIAYARKKGIEEGREQGKQEGRQEGRQEGKAEALRLMTEQLRRMGMDEGTISEVLNEALKSR